MGMNFYAKKITNKETKQRLVNIIKDDMPTKKELYKLINEGIDNKTLDSLKKGGNITMRTLENICRILDCNPNQVVRFVSDKENNNKSEG